MINPLGAIIYRLIGCCFYWFANGGNKTFKEIHTSENDFRNVLTGFTIIVILIFALIGVLLHLDSQATG